MLTVACVLKTGGDYTTHHVEALSSQVWDHLSLPHRFVCLTDVPDMMPKGVEGIALPDDWPGWWAKICLFKKGLIEGPIFFLDLDTMIVKSINDIVNGHRFTVLRNFWTTTGRIGSGLMAWDCDLSHIYESFKKNPQRFIDTYKTKDHWGDQGFITHHSIERWEFWQHKYPGKIVSWKLGCKSGVPEEAAIVCFHGKPRPWDTPMWSLAVKAMSCEQAI